MIMSQENSTKQFLQIFSSRGFPLRFSTGITARIKKKIYIVFTSLLSITAPSLENGKPEPLHVIWVLTLESCFYRHIIVVILKSNSNGKRSVH